MPALVLLRVSIAAGTFSSLENISNLVGNETTTWLTGGALIVYALSNHRFFRPHTELSTPVKLG